MREAGEVLDFWFGARPVSADEAGIRTKMWFGKETETDRVIKERFERTLVEAGQGRLDHWQETPEGSLALILLLDQFSRNMYRGTRLAFAFDDIALHLCLAGRQRRQDLALGIVERAFFCLPLEHSENRSMQQHSVQAFRILLEDAPSEMTTLCQSFLDYAIAHRDIIERFGRFPHRNEALSRSSSPEEVSFLKEPGSSF